MTIFRDESARDAITPQRRRTQSFEMAAKIARRAKTAASVRIYEHNNNECNFVRPNELFQKKKKRVFYCDNLLKQQSVYQFTYIYLHYYIVVILSRANVI